jgi:transposase-like protein
MMTSLTKHQTALIDQLLEGYDGDPKQILTKDGLLGQMQTAFVERVLEGEMSEHLGYARHAREGHGSGNSRNGHGRKTVRTETEQLEIAVPRDREGSFEPQLVKKRQRRLEGFDDKVIALYARGITTREIASQLEELYGVEVSPTLISSVTDAVLDEVRAWQNRPLDPLYPIVYFDALVVKSRQDGRVCNKSVYVALGVNLAGEKEILGLWINETEGAKFWLSVFTELKNRGMRDCFVACVDGLKGLPEAIETVYPQTQVQLCIVHKVRNALKFVPWKERKAVARDLRAIYTAPTLDAAEAALDAFAERWDAKYPAISPAWRADWTRLSVFFDYPPEIRRVIYTTNAIESLNYSLRRVIKNRGAFPSDEAISKVLYLGLRNVAKKWTRPLQNWAAALNQFAILHPERLTASAA